MNFNVIIVSIKESDYRIHFWYMSKDDAIIIMKNSDLKKADYYELFFIRYKNEWNNIWSKKRKTILNRAKEYYENNK